MPMNNRFLFFVIHILFCYFIMTSLHAAAPIVLMPAMKIKGLAEEIKFIKSKTKRAVPFPHLVPKSDERLFAVQSSYDSKPNYREYWNISITTDPKCVAKTCLVGSLTASRTDKLDLDYIEAPFDPNLKPIPKVKIKLNRGFIVYFTPGHAEGDWHSPSLEWQQDGVLYHLSWIIASHEKQTLMGMLRSITR